MNEVGAPLDVEDEVRNRDLKGHRLCSQRKVLSLNYKCCNETLVAVRLK